MQKEKILLYLFHLRYKKKKNLIESILWHTYLIYKKFKTILQKNNNLILSKVYLRQKQLERKILTGSHTFVTIEELVSWIDEWIKHFPSNYDVVVGIPRSGLFVANLIALKMGKPLSTPDLFDRVFLATPMKTKQRYQNILLVDDSIASGKTMEKNIKLLKAKCNDCNITKAAVIANENSKYLVDMYFKIIPRPRIFEWGMIHAKKGKLAVDLDGVICEEIPPGMDSDSEQYVAWLRNAKPYLVPIFEIDAIISNRLEKYRQETEDWLRRHGVIYKNLVLIDAQEKKEIRSKTEHKIKSLLRIKPDIFWESSYSGAEQIWKATRIPTLCISEKILFS